MCYINKSGRQRYLIIWLSLPLLLMLLSGCATKQDVLRVEEQVKQIRNDQRLLKTKIDNVDSLITHGSESDTQLRVELRSSLDDLMARLDQLQSQINDLQQLVYRYSQSATPSQQPLEPVAKGDSASAADGTATTETPSVDCRRLWDNAFKDMRRGQYDLALAGFSDYLKYCPGGELSDNSQYWVAEAYYEMKQYDAAIEEYQKLLDNYPDSEKKSQAYFKLGRCYEEKGERQKALEYFLVLQNEYPGTVEYDQVKDKISDWQEESDN